MDGLLKEFQALLGLVHCDCQSHAESFLLPESIKNSVGFKSSKYSLISYILIDEDDINVISLEKTLEAILNLTDARVCKGKNIKIFLHL